MGNKLVELSDRKGLLAKGNVLKIQGEPLNCWAHNSTVPGSNPDLATILGNVIRRRTTPEGSGAARTLGITTQNRLLSSQVNSVYRHAWRLRSTRLGQDGPADSNLRKD